MRQLQYVSAFSGCISDTILPYVTFLPAGTSPLGVKKMVFVPDGILILNPCASQPVSFAKKFPKCL